MHADNFLYLFNQEGRKVKANRVNIRKSKDKCMHAIILIKGNSLLAEERQVSHQLKPCP
jgi:uncharacterized Fe-S cluster protein YjdI